MLTTPAPPTSMFYSPHGLFDCQQQGVAYAYTTGSSLLVADTGLGKSVIAIALSAMLAEDQAVDHVLLVAKNNKLDEWAEDYPGFSKLTSRVHHGPRRLKLLERDGLPDVLISTFETTRTDLATFKIPPGKRAKVPHDGPLLQALLAAQAEGKRIFVVYDEISAKLRNRSSALYKAHFYALKRLRKAQPDLRAIGLTATPLAKGYEDGFNLLRLLVPDQMPLVGEFEGACIKARDEYGRPKYRKEGIEKFIALSRPFIWRKRKTDPDVRNLFPSRIEETRKIRMGPEQTKLYAAVSELHRPGEDSVPGLYAVLRQVAAHPAALLHSAAEGSSQLARALVGHLGADYLRSVPSAKTEDLVDYLHTIVHEQGDKAVVFTFFGPSVIPLLSEALRREGIRSYSYYAGMTPEEREHSRRSFRADKEACVLLASDMAKDGINLPEASYVIEYESALTHETRVQRFGRHDRIVSGRSSVTCTTMVLMDTVEVRIAEAMLERNEMSDFFNGDTGAEGHVDAGRRRALMSLR